MIVTYVKWDPVLPEPHLKHNEALLLALKSWLLLLVTWTRCVKIQRKSVSEEDSSANPLPPASFVVLRQVGRRHNGIQMRKVLFSG